MKKETAIKRLKTLLAEVERSRETAAVFGKASNELFESKGKNYSVLEEECARAMAEFNEAEAALSQDELVDDKYKTREAASALISYMEDGRANTIEEAIKLYDNEN